DERHPFVDRPERPALEEIWRMDGVPGCAEHVGKGDDPRRQPLGVVEQQHLSHGTPPCRASRLGVRPYPRRAGPAFRRVVTSAPSGLSGPPASLLAMNGSPTPS